ncbi:hypothetical protein WA158_002250 [Blastocystis sp. Blastoise]
MLRREDSLQHYIFCVNLIGSCFGLRLFTLPYYIYQSGLVISVVSAVCVLGIVILSSMSLIKTTYIGKLEYDTDDIYSPYEVFVEQKFGFFGSLVQCVMFVLGCCSTYLSFEYKKINFGLFNIAIFSSIGIITNIVVCTALLIYGFIVSNLDWASFPLWYKSATIDWDTIVSFFFTFSFAFYIPNTVFILHNNELWKGYMIVGIAAVIVIFFSVIVGFFLALVFFDPNDVNGDRTSIPAFIYNMLDTNSWSYILVYGLVDISLLCLSPITLYPCFKAIDFYFAKLISKVDKNENTTFFTNYIQILLRFFICFVVSGVCLFAHLDDAFIANQSWFSSGYIMCVVPGLLHLQIVPKKNGWLILGDVFLCLVGFVLILWGITRL